MKKVFAFAAIAALTLASCNQLDDKQGVELAQNSEISFVSVNHATKGYVEGTDFIDSPYDKLHIENQGTAIDTTGSKAARTLQMSAYVTPQSGASANYFVAQPFVRNANGETDNLWHHNPKVYWPIGAQGVDFLAYSSTKPFAGTAVNWNQENAASKCVLYVSEDYLQDDVLYGAVAGRQTNAGAPVAMTFNHTQAWIQFQIKVEDETMENIVKVNDITIKNIYTRGELTLNGGSTPTASWNFTSETAADRKMDDTYEICAPAFINKSVGYMDMLVPAQAQTSFVMHYTLAGQDNVLEYTYDLATAQWEMGKKYIYEITIKPYEIIVDPSVTPFDEVNPGASGFPSVLE